MNWYDKVLFSEHIKKTGVSIKEDNDWDSVWEMIKKKKKGKKPTADEVQKELLNKFDKNPHLEPATV